MSSNIKKISIRKVKFEKNVKIIQPVNLYECEIGDNTFIGPFCRDTKKCKNWKIVGSKVTVLYVKM